MASPSLSVLACLLLWCVLVGTAQGGLKPLETGRFAPTENNLLTSQPTLESLSSHAQLGRNGAFKFKSGDFRPSPMGGQRVRLIQTYAGLDVMGPSVMAEANEDGVYTGEMHGDVAKSLERDIRFPGICKRNVKLLQNIVIRLEGHDPSDPGIKTKDGQRIIYANPKSGRAKLAYKIEFLYSKNGTVKRPVYIMGACTSLVLLRYNSIHNNTVTSQSNQENLLDKIREQIENGTENFNPADVGICNPYINGVGGNRKIGKRTYNLEPNCLSMEKNGAICRMLGTYVKVIDNQNTEDPFRQDIVTFPCIIGYQDGVNGAYGVANDALFYGEAAGRFFVEKYNMRALPYIPRMVVHYGQNIDNAYWDRTDMYFGDGLFRFHPFVSLDVIAHELAHGVTTRNSDLIYRGQSGGINEAFSDITGEATKYFVNNRNDWMVASSIFKTIGALRYFRNPGLDGRSIKYAWLFRPTMGVHFSSGVFNHAFYAMVKKEKMDIYDAYKCFLDANLNLWGPFTGFYDGACKVMQAAYDNGFNHRKVRRSFMRVGIPLFFCWYSRLGIALRAGETRRNILVKEERSPIFKIDSSNSLVSPSGVRATAEDSSPVKILIATDRDGDSVVASGENEVNFDPSKYSEVFVKLTSGQKSDVKITVKIF